MSAHPTGEDMTRREGAYLDVGGLVGLHEDEARLRIAQADGQVLTFPPEPNILHSPTSRRRIWLIIANGRVLRALEG